MSDLIYNNGIISCLDCGTLHAFCDCPHRFVMEDGEMMKGVSITLDWRELSRLARQAAALRTLDAGIFDAVGALAEWYAKHPLQREEDEE